MSEHLGKIISPGPIDLNCQAVQEHSCQGRGITIAALLDLLLDPRSSAGIDARSWLLESFGLSIWREQYYRECTNSFL